jgi:hypothetical protein
MAIVSIDTSNEDLLKKPIYIPMPEGIYQLEIANKLKVTQSAKKKNMVVVELRCLDDVEKSDGKTAKGMKVVDYIILEPEFEWKLAQLCKACGVESEDGKLDLEDLEGSEISAAVKIENYTGKDGEPAQSNKIDEYLWEGKVVD